MKIVDMQVELIDSMGSDDAVVNAARVSFHKEASNFTKEQNEKLLTYLAKHNHWSPYAHCFLSFRIKVPMFVAMQLDKHTVGLVTNSVSRRYVDDEPEFWLPSVDGWRGRPEGSIKQGSGGAFTDKFFVDGDKETMPTHAVNLCYAAFQLYTQAIHAGVAPEQARMVLPMNTMTERIWSGSLAAFARVCKLRLDSHAQQEIQEVAQKVAALVEPLFPASFKALLNT